jgi:hypothetical protein
MAQESTAIRDLIHLAQGKRIDFDEPAPDLFSVPPSQPAVSLRPAPAPVRVAAGTTPPPVAPLPAMPAKQYRIPTAIQREDEATEMWNTAAHDTSPAVPKILPNVATMVAQPPGRAVPSFLSGPTAPQPQPRPQPSVPVLQPARQPVAYALPQVAQTVAPGFHAAATKPRSSTIAPKPPAPYLVARELASSVFRSRGGIAALAVLALGVGVYLAVASSRGEAKPHAPTERDRAIAIMNGTAQPEPPSVKAPTPPTPTTVVAPPTAEPIESKPTSEPIENKPTSEPIEDTPTAEPIEDTASDEVADATVSVDDIEMEPAAARPAKRASRSARKAKKTVAVVDRSSKRSADPVLAILADKPVKKPKKIEKPKAEPKAPKNLTATEISAPRGAAATTGTGKVTITSDKPALVFLDGRPTGKTAPTALVIPAGDHQITLLDPETKKAKTATIKLEANKSVAIAKTFN